MGRLCQLIFLLCASQLFGRGLLGHIRFDVLNPNFSKTSFFCTTEVYVPAQSVKMTEPEID